MRAFVHGNPGAALIDFRRMDNDYDESVAVTVDGEVITISLAVLGSDGEVTGDFEDFDNVHISVDVDVIHVWTLGELVAAYREKQAREAQ